MTTSGIIDKKLKKFCPRISRLVEETIRKNKLKQASWYKSVSESISYSERYRFFHWELEFPDAFPMRRKGFDLIVINPPWDAIKPYDDDFFSEYHPGFRKIVIKSEKDK